MASQKITTRQAISEWDKYYENFLAAVTADANETPDAKQKRIKALEGDFEEWKVYYFPRYCSAPAAPFHKKASKRALANPELYETRAWSRELAKDVVCMMETIYQALTGIKKNILFISNSLDKASELLEPYRIELTKNERIINDYGIQQMPGSWAYGDFTTTQGVSFLAVGADQSPRGSRSENVRPDKVIVSDIDTDEDVRNPEIIKKRWEWFEKAVYPTRAVDKPFQVMFLGNLIAKDSCIARSMAMADYVDVVNLEDKNGNSSWPEKNTAEHIARIKSKVSAAAYQAEYMNNPLTEGSIFKQVNWGKIPALQKFKFLVTYGDPAPSNSKNKKGSYKCAWLMGYLDGKFYVINGFLDHVTNSDFALWFYNLKDLVNDRSVVYNYIENNSLQNPFYEQVFIPIFAALAKERGHIGITPDTRDKPDKFSRIEGNLEPLNRTGCLILNEELKDNPHFAELANQFLLLSPQMSYPADGPDAVEGGVWIINSKKALESMDAMHFGKRHTNKKRY
ncbi:MAG: hypothetical protein BGO30_07295 [Bacteroidetes bacterium 41-46]|nr:MAG: hypothetical protein BGO30_07295 [Bacteroidetes bacterium 41-46]